METENARFDTEITELKKSTSAAYTVLNRKRRSTEYGNEYGAAEEVGYGTAAAGGENMRNFISFLYLILLKYSNPFCL